MTARRKLRPEERAAANQREAMRRTLHEWVDIVCDAWPAIERQSVEMGPGPNSTALGEIRGGQSEWSGAAGQALGNVERLMANIRPFDPAERAAEWNTARILAFKRLGDLAGDAQRLRPLSPEQVDRARSEGEMATCTRCKMPAPSGRNVNTGELLLRFDKDGRAFHATPCFALGTGCACCGEDDGSRLRQGLCAACYRAWLRAGRPDLEELRHQRALVGLPVVVTTPPPHGIAGQAG